MKNKLLHISANIYPSLYSEHHHTRLIWEELAGHFDEYHIIARSKTNRYSFSKKGNIYLHLVPRITNKSKVFFLTSIWMFVIIKKYKITSLLSQCPIIGGFTASLASNFFKIPLMVELNGREYIKWDAEKKYFGLLKRLQYYVFEHSSKIRYPNNDIKKYLYKAGFGDKSVFIPHRVKHSLFDRHKQKYDITSPVKIVSIGRFVWEKDYEFLIATLSNISIKVKLILIGGGPKRQKYEALAKCNNNLELELIDWIQQEDLMSIVINSDIYIQSSISETGPRTILEAMSMKIPIISSDVGLFSDIAAKYNCGLLYKPHDKEDLTEKLALLIKDKVLREELSRNGYQLSLDKYEWTKVFYLYANEIIGMNLDQ